MAGDRVRDLKRQEQTSFHLSSIVPYKNYVITV